MNKILINDCINGACPICKRKKACHILNSIKNTANSVCNPKYDNIFEIAIYRCPEFIEN